MNKKKFLLLLVSALVPGIPGPAGNTQEVDGQRSASADEPARCASLVNLDLETLPDAPTRIATAGSIPVDERLPTPLFGTGLTVAADALDISEYCAVQGYVGAQIQFELRLPLPADWNGKFLFVACTGFCGTLNGNTCNLGLSRGYATVTSNGGHVGGLDRLNPRAAFDAVWAYDNPQIQEDFGYRANHAVTVAAKAIIEAYYGKPIVRSYMTGCSKGGQAGLAEAQRFPEDFDGIIAGAPVLNYTDKLAIHGAWAVQSNTDENGQQIAGEEAFSLVHDAILSACDALDGVKDGLLTDPRQCDWTPSSLQCDEGVESSRCLTPAQVAVFERRYQAPVDSEGRALFPSGFVKGAELGRLSAFSFTPDSLPEMPPSFVSYYMYQQSIRYLLSPDGSADFSRDDPLQFDFDRDPETLKRARGIYDATDPDLRAFKDRGGKILMWHGWMDEGIPTTASIAYYERVLEHFGGREHVHGFFRLFLLPGVYHCLGGPGPDRFDALDLLDRWVQNDRPPDVIITEKRTAAGNLERTRPVYPYPLVPRYSGSGSTDKAKNFVPGHPSDPSL